MRRAIPLGIVILVFSGLISCSEDNPAYPPHEPTTFRVPEDFSTIQAALNYGWSGDTILIAPGFYRENLRFIGQDVVLGSYFLSSGDTAYISRTVIDGNQAGSVVTFERHESRAAELVGLTLQNGATCSGAGINCLAYTSPTIRSCVIQSNAAGGG